MKFIIVDRTIKKIPYSTCSRLALITRGSKEYILYKNDITNAIFIEYLDIHGGDIVTRRIEDDQEWQDLAYFCDAAGLTTISKDQAFDLS